MRTVCRMRDPRSITVLLDLPGGAGARRAGPLSGRTFMRGWIALPLALVVVLGVGGLSLAQPGYPISANLPPAEISDPVVITPGSPQHDTQPWCLSAGGGVTVLQAVPANREAFSVITNTNTGPALPTLNTTTVRPRRF